MKSAIKKHNYEGVGIVFTEDGWINATQTALDFNKKGLENFLRSKRFMEYAKVVAESSLVKITDLKETVVGKDKEQGTFLHPELAVEFARWISPKFAYWCDKKISELLTTGKTTLNSPVENLKSLEPHTKPEVQRKNSKDVNGYLFEHWNRETLIEYNKRHCKLVSGFSPSELIKIAKDRGMKSKQRSSGKEVLRNLKPAWAAQMSLNDTMVQKGLKLHEANALSAPCVPLLEKMIELNLLSA